MENVKNEWQAMPMLIPYEPEVFWQKMREIVREEMLRMQPLAAPSTSVEGLTYKPLYKIGEVCSLLMITRQTMYEWIRLKTLRPFKVHGRVYFLWEDLQQIMTSKSTR